MRYSITLSGLVSINWCALSKKRHTKPMFLGSVFVQFVNWVQCPYFGESPGHRRLSFFAARPARSTPDHGIMATLNLC